MHAAAFAGAVLALSHLVVPIPLDRPVPTADLVVAGRITTTAGAPLSGANVVVPAARVSVGTDAQGRYRLVLPAAQRGGTIVVRARAVAGPQFGGRGEERDVLGAARGERALDRLARRAALARHAVDERQSVLLFLAALHARALVSGEVEQRRGVEAEVERPAPARLRGRILGRR